MAINKKSLVTKFVSRATAIILTRIERLWTMIRGGGGWMFFFLAVCALSYMIFIKKYFWASLAASWLFSILMLIWISIAIIKRFLQEDQEINAPATTGEQVIQSFEQQYNDFVSKYGRGELYRRAFILVFGEERGGKSNIINSAPVVSNKIKTITKTKGCKWFIAEQEIILDTPGELMKPESGWDSFLEVLATTRPRYPINSIMVVIPIYRLCDPLLEFKETEPPIFYTSENVFIGQKPDTRLQVFSEKLEDRDNEKAHQQRIKELQAMNDYANMIVDKLRMISDILQFQVPVYIVFSKCDLLCGFRDFVNRYSLDKQMLGVRDFEYFDTEFMYDLEQWQLKEGGQRGSIKGKEEIVKSMYVFLENLRSLKDRIQVYDDCFRDLFFQEQNDGGATRKLSHKFQFRGYYFSSCKQYNIANEQGTWTPETKAFFITDLFQKKFRQEYGLAKAYTNKKRAVETRVKIAKLLTSLTILVLFAFSWVYYAKSYQKIDAMKQHSQQLAKLEFVQLAKEYPKAETRRKISTINQSTLGKTVQFDKDCKSFMAKGMEKWLLIPLWRSYSFDKEGQTVAATIFYKMVFKTTLEIALQKMREDIAAVPADSDQEQYLRSLLHKIGDVDAKYQLYQKTKEQSAQSCEQFRQIYEWVFSEPIEENIAIYFSKEYAYLAKEIIGQLKDMEATQLIKAQELVQERLEEFFRNGFFPKCQAFGQVYETVKKSHDALLAKYNDLGNGMGLREEFGDLSRKVFHWKQIVTELKLDKNDYKRLLQSDEEHARMLLSVLEKNRLLPFAKAWEIYQKQSGTEGSKRIEQLANFSLAIALGNANEITMADLYQELIYIALKVEVLKLLQPGEEVAKLENNQQLLDGYLQELNKREKELASREIVYQSALDKAWNETVSAFCRNVLNRIIEDNFKKQVQKLNQNFFNIPNVNELENRIEDYLRNLTTLLRKNISALPIMDQLAKTITDSDDSKLSIMQLQRLQDESLPRVKEFLKDRSIKDFIEIKTEELPKIKGDSKRVNDAVWGKLFFSIKKFYVTEADSTLAAWIIADLKSQVSKVYSPFEAELIEYWRKKSLEYIGDEDKLDLLESLFEAGKVLFFSLPGDPKLLKEYPDLKEKVDAIRRLYAAFQKQLIEYFLTVADARKLTDRTREGFLRKLFQEAEKYSRLALKVIPEKFHHDELKQILKAIEGSKKAEITPCDQLTQCYLNIITPWCELRKEIGDVRNRKVQEEMADNKPLLDKIFILYKDYQEFKIALKNDDDSFFKNVLLEWQECLDKELQSWKDKSVGIIGAMLLEKYTDIAGKFPFARKTAEDVTPEEVSLENVDDFFQKCTEFLKYKEFLGQEKVFKLYQGWLPVLYGGKKKGDVFNVQQQSWTVRVTFPASNKFITNIILRKEEQKASDPQSDLASWYMGREDRNEFSWKLGTPIYLEFRFTADPRLDFITKYDKLVKKSEQKVVFKLPEGKWGLFRFADLYSKSGEGNNNLFAFDYKVFRKGAQSVTSAENVSFSLEIYCAKKIVAIPWE